MTEFQAAAYGRFIAYEYTRIDTVPDRESLYRDTYANFGWELDGRQTALQDSGSVTLKFKRDRGINNRSEVTALQRTCDRALTAISKAERTVSSTAIAVAAVLGVVGAGLLAGSIFALNADLTLVSIALGANGLLAWIAGFFAYGRVAANRAAKIAPSIDEQYRVVLDTGERAYALLQDSTRQRAVQL